MRQALALTAGFLSLLFGQQSYAQELPVFDDEDFEIVSVEPNSQVIARSNGRDFYCLVYQNDEAGYVEVSRCVPFVSPSEAAEVKAMLAEAEAEEAKARAEEAEAVASEGAIQRQADVDKQLASLDPEVARAAVFRLARQHGCALLVEDRGISNQRLVESLLLEAGFKITNFDQVIYEKASSRFSEVMATLEAEGKIEFLHDETIMVLKDCN